MKYNLFKIYNLSSPMSEIIKPEIVYKNVKHLRLQMSRDGQLKAIAPMNMSPKVIFDFVEKKQGRIKKQMGKIKKSKKNAIKLGSNQILLHGRAYTHVHNPDMGDSYHVDHTNHFVWWGHELTHVNHMQTRYRAYAKKILTHRLEQLSHKFDIGFERCFIRDQKTKRGTCSSKGNIGLNRKLIKAPSRVMDYVIIHELCHRLQMNHSPAFWAELDARFDRVKEAKIWLKENGQSLHE